MPAVRLNPDVPPKLEDIINKALEKDRNLRYQHAAEMRADLQRLKRDTETGRAGVVSSGTVAAVQDAAPQSGAQRGVPSDLEFLKQAKYSRLLRGWPLLTSLVVLTIALAFFVIFLLRAKQIQRGVEIVQVTALPGFEWGPSFSPDGSQIVFTLRIFDRKERHLRKGIWGRKDASAHAAAREFLLPQLVSRRQKHRLPAH